MKFNIYTVWLDPVFYAAAAVFAASLFFLVYSIRRYVELKNSDAFDEVPDGEPSADLPGPESEPEIPSAQQSEIPAGSALGGPSATEEQPAPLPGAGPDARGGSDANMAEAFVKGIYEGLSSLDARLKNIEASVSKGKGNNDFTAKFLEDILSDLESLDKEKIKARIEYLLSDIKK
ncbi:MAG: hypothetical protein NTX59_03185 [Elusimicrobia bacterium]|nr:hypothetical protein [Elusimicrobiota bacterium]